MAVQYPTFGKLTSADMGVPDYAEALNKGLNLSQNLIRSLYAPRNAENASVKAEQYNEERKPYAENAMRTYEADIGGKEANIGLIPLRQRLLESQIARQNKLSEDPFGGHIPTGDLAQVYWLDKIKNQYGEDSPYYTEAKKAYELHQNQQQGLIDYRNQLMKTAPKRASTQLGKLNSEMDEIKSGFLPGSNGQVPLEDEEKEILLGQYGLASQKLHTDVDTRKKLLYATNLDKTLDNVNADDLTQFGGLAGGIVKKIQEGKSLTGNESAAYDKYHQSLTAVKLLAKQVRQFYGDSITPQIQEQLGDLVNPATWSINPKLAKLKFNQFKNIIHQETQTYRDAAKNTHVYQNAPETNSQNEELTFNPITGRLE